MYGRGYFSPPASEAALAVEFNPFIRSDDEILGKWSTNKQALMLLNDNTFSYQISGRVVTGHWTRQDYDLSLKSDSDDCCNTMRFVKLYNQYFLLTDPPDFSEVEGRQWIDEAIASALIKEEVAKKVDASAIPIKTECKDVKHGLEINQLIGKEITLRGKFELAGLVGPYISCGSEEIYLEPHPSPAFIWDSAYEKIQQKIVSFTGILHFRHFDPCPDGEDMKGNCQLPPDYYYFDAETVKVSTGE